MRAINLIKVGDYVSAGLVHRAKVIGIRDGRLLLQGYENSGYYFIPRYFRKVG